MSKWKTELEELLSPQKIAVFGATEKTGPARNVIRNLIDVGFAGQIYPVNPNYQEVFGYKCYPSLKELPEAPHSVVIAVPAKIVNDALAQCAEIGCHAVTVLSSGFSEIGGQGIELQAKMSEIANSNRINICGPNCLGHLDFINRTGAYSGSIIAGSRPGKVAVVSQSGSMAISMYQSFKNIGISHVVSYGNQAVTGLSDYLTYLANDPHTKVITTFIEGMDDGPAFREAIKLCRDKGKAVVALKIGKSEISKKIAMAHTASLVGSDKVYKEVFKEGGVLEVNDIDEMIQTVTALVKTPAIKSKGVAITAISGGQCGIIGDIAEEIGLEISQFSPDTAAKIKAIVPDFVSVKNPLDVALVGSRDYADYLNVLRCFTADPQIGLIAVMQDAPLGVGPSTVEHYQHIVRAVIEAAQESGKAILVFTNHSTPYEPKIVQALLDADMPFLQGTKEALHAIRHLAQYYLPEKEAAPTQAETAKLANIDWDKVGGFIEDYQKCNACLGEKEGKELISLLNIPVTKDVICRSAQEVREAVRAIGGKVALKIDSPDIMHKTDVGGVALDLDGEEEAAAAYQKMLAAVKEKMPAALINGVAVQEMVQDGVDLIIGMNKDSQFGPVLVFGLGGIYVELFKDSSLGLVPVYGQKAEQMIKGSQSYKLLQEARGRQALDIRLLEDILIKLSGLMERYGDKIKEIDLNPVRIGLNGVKVLDALFVFEK